MAFIKTELDGLAKMLMGEAQEISKAQAQKLADSTKDHPGRCQCAECEKLADYLATNNAHVGPDGKINEGVDLEEALGPKGYEAYEYRVYNGKDFLLHRRGDTWRLTKGTEFGIRDAGTAHGKYRVIDPQRGHTKIFTLEPEEYPIIQKNSKLVD